MTNRDLPLPTVWLLADRRFIITDQHGHIMHAPLDLPWVGKTLDELKAERPDLTWTPMPAPAKA